MKATSLISYIEFCIKTSPKNPILITGKPGIGKSDIVRQVAEKLDMDLIIGNPYDPTEITGFPFADFPNKIADFLAYGYIEKVLTAKKPTIFFLDELGQKSASIQASLMPVLLDRRANGRIIPDNVFIISATNRKIDKGGIVCLLNTIITRFTSGVISLDVNLDDWILWALQHNMPMELIAHNRFNPKYLIDGEKYVESNIEFAQTPCPRTIAAVGKKINDNIAESYMLESFAGIAGKAFATEFIAYLQMFRNLPDMDLIIKFPDSADIPTRLDVLYATCGGLAYKANKTNFGNIVRYANRLPKEFSMVLITDCIRKDNTLTETFAYIDWATKNHNILS